MIKNLFQRLCGIEISTCTYVQLKNYLKLNKGLKFPGWTWSASRAPKGAGTPNTIVIELFLSLPMISAVITHSNQLYIL